MPHTKNFRHLSGEPRYNKVVVNLQHKIMDVAGLNPGALSAINDALWDSNPQITYTDSLDRGVLNITTMARFFTKLEEYILAKK